MSSQGAEAPQLFLLLDASVVAPYYLPESSSRRRVPARIGDLIEAVRGGGAPYMFLYIPAFCVAEVLGVFDKYRFGSWNAQVRRVVPGGISQRKYEKARNGFLEDIRYCGPLNTCELSQYHVVATDLISPVDHYYQYYRRKSREIHKRPMGTYDHMIIAMGVHLSKIHGADNFLIVTADHRLGVILDRARSLAKSTARALGLAEKAKRLDLDYGPGIYPRVMNLSTSSNQELAGMLRCWPLPLRALPLGSDCELEGLRPDLAKLYSQFGVHSDRLPYAAQFDRLYSRFLSQTRVYVTKSRLWELMLRMRKAGELPALGRAVPA